HRLPSRLDAQRPLPVREPRSGRQFLARRPGPAGLAAAIDPAVCPAKPLAPRHRTVDLADYSAGDRRGPGDEVRIVAAAGRNVMEYANTGRSCRLNRYRRAGSVSDRSSFETPVAYAPGSPAF